MRISFTQSYAEPDAGYAKGKEYDFIDQSKANYFIDHGLAVPVETFLTISEDIAGETIKNSKGESMQVEISAPKTSNKRKNI